MRPLIPLLQMLLLSATMAAIPASAQVPAPAPLPAECQARWSAGEQAYLASDFSRARQAWEPCLLEGRASDARLWFALGNACYRLGDLGCSIHAFRKTLLIHPGDEDALANLRLAETRRIDRQQEPEVDAAFALLARLHNALGIDAGLRGGLLLLFLANLLAALAWWAAPGRWRALAVGGAVVLALLQLPLWGSTLYKVALLERTSEGVVQPAAVDVMSGPGEQFQVLATLHAGTVLELQGVQGEWRTVRLGEELVGFVPSGALRLVR